MHGRSVSTVTAYTAHREWATGPPDERYASVQALVDAARARRNRTEARITETVNLRVRAAGTDALVLDDQRRTVRALTHWSFEQLAGLAGAPPHTSERCPRRSRPTRSTSGCSVPAASSISSSRTGRTVDPPRDHLSEVRAGPP